MYYLVIGLIEIVAMIFFSIFHSGMITNISGLLLFVTAMMIPLGNFMAVNRSSGNMAAKLLLSVSSVVCMLLELLGLYHKVEIPELVLRLMFAYIGVSSILVYVDQKLHPGHRSTIQETQDTLR